jgi:hypothetical protein
VNRFHLSPALDTVAILLNIVVYWVDNKRCLIMFSHVAGDHSFQTSRSAGLRGLAGVLLATCLVLTAGCAVDGVRESTEDSGSILLRSSAEDVSSQGFVPEESLDVVRYEVQGTGPGGNTFSIQVMPDSGTMEVPGLLAGEWTVGISATNANGYQIGSGTHIVTVRPGERSEVTLTVQDRTVTGGARVEVAYGDTVDNAVLTADLYPPGSQPPLTLGGSVPGEGSVALESTTITPGYYELHVNLSYGEWGQWRTVSTIRIATELQTSATFTLPDEDLSTGNVEFGVTHLGGFPVQFDLDYLVEGSRRLPDGSWASWAVLFEGVVGPGESGPRITIADLPPGSWQFLLTATDPQGGGSEWFGRMDQEIPIPAATATSVPVMLDSFNTFPAGLQ